MDIVHPPASKDYRRDYDDEFGLTTEQWVILRRRREACMKFLVSIMFGVVAGVVATVVAALFFPALLPLINTHIIIRPTLNFLVLGDWGREGFFNQSAVAAAMGNVGLQVHSSFVISTGDNFYENGLSSSEDPLFSSSFSSVYTHPSLQTPWLAVLGNHDYISNPLSQLDPSLKQRDWRWTCRRNYREVKSLCAGLPPEMCSSSIEFFFIDTNPFVNSYWGKLNFTSLPSKGEIQDYTLFFLQEALSTSSATWKVVVGHHPVRSMGQHGDQPELVSLLLPLLVDYEVDAYLNGHDHSLQLIRRPDCPVLFITSGAGSMAYRPQSPSTEEQGVLFDYNGQGFVAVAAKAEELHFAFHDIYGKKLFTYNISKNL